MYKGKDQKDEKVQRKGGKKLKENEKFSQTKQDYIYLSRCQVFIFLLKLIVNNFLALK